MAEQGYGDVRLAVEDDRAALTELTTLLHGENGLFSLSANKRDMLLDRYYQQKGAVIGVIGDPGKPVASIHLSIVQPDYTDDWILIENWNFVHPDHRRSNYARQLIAYAKHISDEMSIPLMVGIVSNTRTEAKVRMYEQLLEKAGAYFIYNRQLAGGTAWG